MTSGQTQYQVRFDWGLEGARAIGVDADVVVIVDALRIGATEHISAGLDGHGGQVVIASLRNRTAVAGWILGRQGDKGERFMVAGERWPDGATRFAIEDLLAAGAVIDALAELGIDYCSPEAAAASAAFTGLRNATGHLVGASASGRELAAAGSRADVDRAIEIDASTTVPVLKE